MIVYDAEGQILGRLCSIIAKKLLEGNNVSVVNAEGAVISGNKKSTISDYRTRVKRGDPFKGPHFPRTPDRIFRRAVRGMLPRKKPKGREAYKRLRVYMGVPENFKGKEGEFERPKVSSASKLTTSSITIGELSLALGAKKRW